MIKSKKQMLTVISVFILIIMLTTVTYAFFNYTRTGTANVIRTGRISFNANQTETINLTNVFPIDKATIGIDTVNTDETVITITGDTTYTEGIEYLVTAVDVNNTIGSGNNAKSVPISVSVTASNGLGTEDEEYFDNRENANGHLYRVLANDVLTEDGRIAIGYIKAGANGINGTLTIKAYLDKDKVAISDTYNGEESDNMGTTTEWVDNRTTLTTTEWNSLQTNGVSFKVKVESNEGIWVEEELSVNTMNTFPTVITDEKANIKEVYFNKMGATRMQQAYDAATIKADLTYNNEGKVLAWLEENIDDNTKYNLIIASDGETYLTTGLTLFQYWTSMEKIEFNNANMINVTNMTAMFYHCNELLEIDMSGTKAININSFEAVFLDCTNLVRVNLSGLGGNSLHANSTLDGCSNLKEVNLSYFNFGGCTNLQSIFGSLGHSNIEIIDMSNAIGNSLTSISNLFDDYTNLRIVNMSGFTANNLTAMNYLFASDPNLEVVEWENFYAPNLSLIQNAFQGCSKLEIIDLSWINSNNLAQNAFFDTFLNCTSLEKIYVSNSFDASNQYSDMPIFGNNTSLIGGNGTSYAENNPKDKTYAIIDGTNGQPGYFTDIADKPTN